MSILVHHTSLATFRRTGWVLTASVLLAMAGDGIARAQAVRYYEDQGVTYRETRQYLPRWVAENYLPPAGAVGGPPAAVGAGYPAPQYVAQLPAATGASPAAAPPAAPPAVLPPAGATSGYRETVRMVPTPVTEYRYEAYWRGRWNPFAKKSLAYRLVPRTRWEYRPAVTRYPAGPAPATTYPGPSSPPPTYATNPAPGPVPPPINPTLPSYAAAPPSWPAGGSYTAQATAADQVEVITRVPIARRADAAPPALATPAPPPITATRPEYGGIDRYDDSWPGRNADSGWRASREIYYR